MNPRRLLLLRHAKASRDDPSVEDITRGLTKRGRLAAKAMGRAMRDLGLRPDLVLCSPARRAQETWALVAAEWDWKPPARTVPDLYDFGDGTMVLDIIRREAGTVRTLMLVGHNPAFEKLAPRLAGPGNPDLRAAMEQKYPTAALAVLSFDLPWHDLTDNSCTLTARMSSLIFDYCFD